MKKLPKRFGMRSLEMHDRFTIVLHMKYREDITISNVERPTMEKINELIFKRVGQYDNGETYIQLGDVTCHEVRPEKSWTEDML